MSETVLWKDDFAALRLGKMNAEFLLIADLDGALLGDRDSLQRFAEWYRDASWRVRLAYASERSLGEIRNLVSDTELPEPNALIGGSGSQIELYPRRQILRLPGVSSPDYDVGAAADALAAQWRIPASRVIVCPATTVVRTMLGHGFNGVIVHNAADELRRVRGRAIYHARRPYAAGVLEGVGRWMADGKLLAAFA